MTKGQRITFYVFAALYTAGFVAILIQTAIDPAAFMTAGTPRQIQLRWAWLGSGVFLVGRRGCAAS